MNLFISSLLIGLAAFIVAFFHNRDWVYIPSIVAYFEHPLGKNIPVVWTPSTHANTGQKRTNIDKPNVIVILVDDLGFNDISFFNEGFHGIIPTPNINSIAHSGVSFTNAYAGHATCAPSRASLLTGRFATKIGYEYTPVSDWGSWVIGSYMDQGALKGRYKKENSLGLGYENMTLPKSELTMGEIFQREGYKTLQLGKW